MNEPFYKLVRMIGERVFRHASESRVLHADRAARSGAFLLAANHRSPYDAPLLIAAMERPIYWLSIVEIFRNPFLRRFLKWMGAEPLQRDKVDTQTVRAIVRNLQAGRVVGIFPEGGMRTDDDSVLTGGTMHEGVCKLAQLANVPVVPCVVLGGEKFSCWTRWLPGAGTRWVVAYGEPLFPSQEPNRQSGRAAMMSELTLRLRELKMEAEPYA